MTKIEAVSIIYQAPKVLLGKKAKFVKIKYEGFGGGVEIGESLKECITRETFEEAGITIIDPEIFGKILFEFEGEQDRLAYFYRVTEFSGIPQESEEMIPEWFYENEIPYDQMWGDDRYWLPLLLEGRKFIGNFYFNKELKISRYELNEVEKLENGNCKP